MLECFFLWRARCGCLLWHMCSGRVWRCSVHGCSLVVSWMRPSTRRSFHVTYSREIRDEWTANGCMASPPPPQSCHLSITPALAYLRGSTFWSSLIVSRNYCYVLVTILEDLSIGACTSPTDGARLRIPLSRLILLGTWTTVAEGPCTYTSSHVSSCLGTCTHMQRE